MDESVAFESMVLEDLTIDAPATKLITRNATLATGNICEDSFDWNEAIKTVHIDPPRPEFVEKNDEEIKRKNENFIEFIKEVEILFGQSKEFEMEPSQTQPEVPETTKEKQLFNAITITEMKYDEACINFVFKYY